LEVDGDLFEGIPFGRLGGQANGFFSGVTVSHPVFTQSSHNPDFCQSQCWPD
jgi:hypothetical protein